MNARFNAEGNDRSESEALRRSGQKRLRPDLSAGIRGLRLSTIADDLIDVLAPCPWGASTGRSPLEGSLRRHENKPALYTPEERLRRDASPWTIVQGVLAPLQFVIFAVSLILVARYLLTGRGYEIATYSILAKTLALYLIMITGSIWEKEVFGQWLFVHAFFWEDVFSMLVLGLQTAYLVALFAGWGTARQQMMIAIAAYATYVINATQFLLKLRAARLEGARPSVVSRDAMGHPA
jgi:3-vinyl bacteriochlorophyllide hydratase